MQFGWLTVEIIVAEADKNLIDVSLIDFFMTVDEEDEFEEEFYDEWF